MQIYLFILLPGEYYDKKRIKAIDQRLLGQGIIIEQYNSAIKVGNKKPLRLDCCTKPECEWASTRIASKNKINAS